LPYFQNALLKNKQAKHQAIRSETPLREVQKVKVIYGPMQWDKQVEWALNK
jgi:hypothetical protein